ncbi:hypothetical protein HN51_056415 [Arachis hypogaea]
MGRFLVGLGVSFASITALIYIVKVSPSEIRGGLISANCLMITSSRDLALDAWTCSYTGSYSIVLMMFLPESPRWLYHKNKKEEATTDEIAILEDHLEQESKNKVKVKFSDVFKLKEIRLAFICGAGLQAFQQFVGISVIMYYNPIII